MDKPNGKGAEKPKRLTPEQLTQLTQNWADLFKRLAKSENGHDEAQRLIQGFDVLNAIGDGFFEEGRHSLIVLRHDRLRVDYSKTLGTLLRSSGVTTCDRDDRRYVDVTNFPVREDRKGMWECGLNVVALAGLKRGACDGEPERVLNEFGFKFADAHQAYEFAGVCPTTALPKCVISVGGTLAPEQSDFHLMLSNYATRDKIVARWNARRMWGFARIDPTLQKRIFLLAVRDEKPVE